MSPEEFKHICDRQRVIWTRSPHGGIWVEGRHGTVEADGLQLLVAYLPAPIAVPCLRGMKQRWAYFKTTARGLGMQIIQDGDCEGVIAFRPYDNHHWAEVIKRIRPRRRRPISEPVRERLRQLALKNFHRKD